MTRSGFTLIEVLLALAVGALTVLLAHRVFAATTDGTRAVRSTRAALDREANARRWQQAAFLSLDVGTASGTGFEGRADRATFSTWLQTAGAWHERRRVTLAARDGRFLALPDAGEGVRLADSVTAVAFDYLLVPGEDSKWVREWISPVSAPLAVRVRVTRSGNTHRVDTMLFLVKERG